MASFPFLVELVEESAAGLPAVTKRRMFGCDVFFAGERIFAVVWKTGRIGVKLPDPASHAEAMAASGAEPWRIGAKKMSSWVLVPEEWHDELETLRPWLRRAYAQVNAGERQAARAPARRVAARR